MMVHTITEALLHSMKSYCEYLRIIWVGTSILYALMAAKYAANQFKREDIVTSLS